MKNTPPLCVTLYHQDIVYDQILLNETSNYPPNIINRHVSKNKQKKKKKPKTKSITHLYKLQTEFLLKNTSKQQVKMCKL
jgi:hypothetical protein